MPVASNQLYKYTIDVLSLDLQQRLKRADQLQIGRRRNIVKSIQLCLEFFRQQPSGLVELLTHVDASRSNMIGQLHFT